MPSLPPPPPPRDIGVLLFEGFSNFCLANAVEPLRAANTFAGRPVYRWELLTVDGGPAVSSSGLPVTPHQRLSQHRGGDALFLLPSYGFLDHGRPDVLRALRAAATRFRTVVGLDTGAWLMAAAGLLAGRRATIHWDEIENMAEAFPDIEVTDDRYVIDGNRITCGGATTAFELVLELIRREHGAMLRVEVAALFMHGEPIRETDPVFRPSRSARLDAAVAQMRRNLERPLPIPEIAAGVGLSQRAFEGLMRRTLGLSPVTVYRKLRLSHARRLLQQTGLAIPEIAIRSGYGDASAFARAFRAEFGQTPSTLRQPQPDPARRSREQAVTSRAKVR
jgi:transcriptional regulator GlxA family with amidase domain